MGKKGPYSWHAGVGRSMRSPRGKSEARYCLQGLTSRTGSPQGRRALRVRLNKVFRYDKIEDKLDNGPEASR